MQLRNLANQVKNNFYSESFTKKQNRAMLFNIQPFQTELTRLQEIPTAFFANLEASVNFDDALFPDWIDTAFAGTQIKNKFNAIYTKYKSLADPAERARIIDAFTNNNQIESLCRNQAGLTCIPLANLHESIRDEIDQAFLYLYESALEYHGFTSHVADTIKDATDRFIRACGMQICPTCGLEGYLNLEGQSRIALDHWLCKDIYPVNAVNFWNLFPLGDKCNGRPAKGTKNILIDEHGDRIVAFYAYQNHHAVNVSFSYNNEPSINPLVDADWNLNIVPNDVNEQLLFDSWESIFNIRQRYKAYFRKIVFPLWENGYKAFIDDAGLGHANDVPELKQRFGIWRASFNLKSTIGAYIHRAFIDNMINNCSEAYLFSLCENFKSQAA
jgi:hypothetical protein